MMINNSFRHTYNKPTSLPNQEVGLFFSPFVKIRGFLLTQPTLNRLACVSFFRSKCPCCFRPANSKVAEFTAIGTVPNKPRLLLRTPPMRQPKAQHTAVTTLQAEPIAVRFFCYQTQLLGQWKMVG